MDSKPRAHFNSQTYTHDHKLHGLGVDIANKLDNLHLSPVNICKEHSVKRSFNDINLDISMDERDNISVKPTADSKLNKVVLLKPTSKTRETDIRLG